MLTLVRGPPAAGPASPARRSFSPASAPAVVLREEGGRVPTSGAEGGGGGGCHQVIEPKPIIFTLREKIFTACFYYLKETNRSKILLGAIILSSGKDD